MSSEATYDLQRQLESAMKGAQQSGDRLEHIRHDRGSIFDRSTKAQAWNDTQDEYDEYKQRVYDLKQQLYRMPDGKTAVESAYRQFLFWKDAYRRGGGWNGICTEDDSDWLY
jgi:hypothetical protein